ncbi:hypothetical protein [Flavobacterium sp. FPG59]|jgi:hypothetical protein|uniref:hypothetical protein n=1 Tax=Flavobacterium sp. FPG59 TaxID=1929267 RepID=UPI000A3AEE8F|nr:hypothetical protein [Flavobacterium sp. FPG59]OUD32742.1 hypothetical protein FPG59_14280 [Flavobacterium sp. FPG59]
MRVQSKFKFLVIFLVFYITILPPLVIYLSATSPVADMVLPVLFLLFVVFFWLTVLRTRAFKVEMDGNTVIIKRYFGLGKSIGYDLKSLDGFITIVESAKGGVYESIFILKDGKRVGSISSFYHSNFEELKSILKEKLIDFGERNPNFKLESSELFR